MLRNGAVPVTTLRAAVVVGRGSAGLETRIARLRGRRRRILEIPVLSPRLSSYWLHLVTPVRASVARPLVEGLRNPTVARDERIRRLLPRDLVSFDDAARGALAP